MVIGNIYFSFVSIILFKQFCHAPSYFNDQNPYDGIEHRNYFEVVEALKLILLYLLKGLSNQRLSSVCFRVRFQDNIEF